VPKNMQGKVIGRGGDTLKDIESDYPGVKLIMPARNSDSEDVVITGPADGVNRAKMRVLDICGMAPDVTGGARERARRLHEEVDKIYERMRSSNTKAEKDGFRRQADGKQKEAKAADEEAARMIFKSKNSGYGDDQMDLHGLYVKEAMELVEQRLNRCDARLRKGEMTLTIITGAGNHSENYKAKIKPQVEALLKKGKYPFTSETTGAYFIAFSEPSSEPLAPKKVSQEESTGFIGMFCKCLSFCFSNSKGPQLEEQQTTRNTLPLQTMDRNVAQV